MEGMLFALVNAHNHDEVYAWGMEIVTYDRVTEDVWRRDAVVYRYDPVSDRPVHGHHGSAEEACRFHSRLATAELEVMWQDGDVAAPENAAMPRRYEASRHPGYSKISPLSAFSIREAGGRN